MIHVVDSIMGAGKTSWAIQHMMSKPIEKFLYVTPYLNECSRIVEACGSERFKQPHDKGGMAKLDSLKNAMAEGFSIATTHELFKRIDTEAFELVEEHGYILILDEVIEVIRPVNHEKFDIDEEGDKRKYSEWVQALLDHQVLVLGKPNEDGSISTLKAGSEGRLGMQGIRRDAEEGRLILVNGVMLIWLFPTECFSRFKEVYNLTYLFDGQVQKAYFDIHGLEYEVHSIVQNKTGKATSLPTYSLVKWDPSLDQEVINKARQLINIYDGPSNDIGWATGKGQPLSKSWYLKNRKLGNKVMASCYKWFQRHAEAKQKEALWTVYKPIFRDGKGLSPQGFKKSFLSSTTRATNAYRDRKAVAYLINVFFRVPVSKYLSAMRVELDERQFALSEMIQFIWRSRIRDGKPIDLFVPSARMREILHAWLSCENNKQIVAHL